MAHNLGLNVIIVIIAIRLITLNFEGSSQITPNLATRLRGLTKLAWPIGSGEGKPGHCSSGNEGTCLDGYSNRLTGFTGIREWGTRSGGGGDGDARFNDSKE